MKKIRTIVASILAITFITSLAAGATAYPEPAATVYIDQPTITATAVGQEFTVTVYVKNVVDLYGWQIGMKWDSTMLNCTAFTYDYSWFGPEGDTIKIPGKINNTIGEIYGPYSCSLTTGTGTGKSTTEGKPLASATFKAKAIGTTDIHLSEIKLKNSTAPIPETIPTNIIDVFTAMWKGNPYPIVTLTNLTGLTVRYRLFNHTFDEVGQIFKFYVIGPDGATVFFNVTIPKALLWGNATYPWVIEVNDVNITARARIVENATHTFIYFTDTLSTHKVEIWVVPEFPALMIIPILIIATIVTAALGKGTHKTKHRNPILNK